MTMNVEEWNGGKLWVSDDVSIKQRKTDRLIQSDF